MSVRCIQGVPSVDPLEVLPLHLEAEFLLDQHDHVHHFQAVDPEVLFQAGIVLDLVLVNLQFVHEEDIDFLLYLVDIHITCVYKS